MSIRIEKVSKSFGTKPVLNQINLNINEGEVFSLIGPNGAGKTTTMRCIYGDLLTDNGEIRIFNEKINPRLKERMAVMNEGRLNFGRFKGEDYMSMWRRLYPKWNEKVFSSFVVHYNFNLKELVENYSMGMKTLFNLALCMASGADLLILDEPTQNLDPIIRQETLTLIRDFSHKEGKTVLLSSHEIYELEEISSSFALIREGVVLYSDTIDGAKENHRIVDKGEKVPVGEIIGIVNNNTLLKTNEDIGKFPTFREVVLGYLQGRKGFMPFED